jgi:hypothetical protein
MMLPSSDNVAQVESAQPQVELKRIKIAPGSWLRLTAELIAVIYMSVIAAVAAATGAVYVLFPELGALSHDVFTRPRGTWAASPLLLAITPALTGVVGIFFTCLLPYGFLSVLAILTVSIVLIIALRSPIAPAISAGLLPLVLEIKSWWYPAGILFGTGLLGLLSLLWTGVSVRLGWLEPATLRDVEDEEIEHTGGGFYWLIALMAFVVVAVGAVKLTGLRFLLFPPLVVIGFEMFGHTEICPWAKRPLFLPLACFMTACAGFFFCRWLGPVPLAAACSMACGIVVLRLFNLHVPPALAVALIPMVMDHATIMYPVSVGIGTLVMTLWFLAYQRLFLRKPAVPA